MHLSVALEAYVVQLQADGRAASTIYQTREHVGMLERWLRDRSRPLLVNDITHEHLARFLSSPAVQMRRDAAPRKATSANVLRSKLRAFFAYLADAGYVDRNPARLIRRAKCGPPPPRTLPKADCRKLLAALAQGGDPRRRRDRALFELILTTGIRIGSAVALRVEDLDLDAGEARLRHAKGDREEVVFLPRAVVRRLRGEVRGRRTGPVFGGAAGQCLGARHARVRLQQGADRAGLNRRVTPHMLRHTMAGKLYRRTGDLLLVQQALGHRSIASTTVYATVGPDRLRAALAV
jgi:integrase/recombinase XerC